MKLNATTIAGVWEVETAPHRDERGVAESRADIERYVADARRAGLPWAMERMAEAA